MSNTTIYDMQSLLQANAYPLSQFSELRDSVLTQINVRTTTQGRKIGTYEFSSHWKQQPKLKPFIEYLENFQLDLNDPENVDFTIYQILHATRIHAEMLKKVNLGSYFASIPSEEMAKLQTDPTDWPKDKAHFKLAEMGFWSELMGYLELEKLYFEPKLLFADAKHAQYPDQLLAVGYHVGYD